MDQDLISKRELLELTGISYGQLYRWKRKNLIPEEWFIRKSTFTGQETFFPREKILARLDKIRDLKDDRSLDDVAEVLSPSPARVSLSLAGLAERNLVSQPALELFRAAAAPALAETTPLAFDGLVAVYVLDRLLQTGEIGRDEGRAVLDALAEHYGKVEGKDCDLLFLRKLGVSTCLLVSPPSEVHLEHTTKLVARLSLTACLEELKLKLAQA
jgi:DNA-binding transcriptional MerR regulator